MRRFYVVKAEYCSRDDDEAIWTVSTDPKEPGWETDSGFPGYGLPKELAEFLAAAGNEKLEREQEDARHLDNRAGRHDKA